jgi:hypothetical protein
MPLPEEFVMPLGSTVSLTTEQRDGISQPVRRAISPDQNALMQAEAVEAAEATKDAAPFNADEAAA